MVASIGKIASPSQGVSYFEKDGYYARDDAAHKEPSAWAGMRELMREIVDKLYTFQVRSREPGFLDRLGIWMKGASRWDEPKIVDSFLPGLAGGEGAVPDPFPGMAGWRFAFAPHPDPVEDMLEDALYRIHLFLEDTDGSKWWVGIDLVTPDPESAHMLRAALDWMEAEFLQTRGYDPATGRRPRVKADGLVAATFRHVASRNNDPQLHTHAVIANMTRNAAGEWRSVEPTGAAPPGEAPPPSARGEPRSATGPCRSPPPPGRSCPTRHRSPSPRAGGVRRRRSSLPSAAGPGHSRILRQV